jgi:hypothetical protein
MDDFDGLLIYYYLLRSWTYICILDRFPLTTAFPWAAIGLLDLYDLLHTGTEP